MATNTISIGRIQTTLPKKLYLGSETPQLQIPEYPKGTRLVTVNADSSNSQHFYFCTRGDNKKEGVLATFDLLYIIERSPTLEAPPGLHYQKSPQPYFVNGAEYPSWVKEDMMLILEATGGCDSPYIFRTKSDPKIVLSCFQDEVGAPITMEEYHVTGNTSRQRFTLQNPPS